MKAVLQVIKLPVEIPPVPPVSIIPETKLASPIRSPAAISPTLPKSPLPAVKEQPEESAETPNSVKRGREDEETQQEANQEPDAPELKKVKIEVEGLMIA